jgi:hypothetical protein
MQDKILNVVNTFDNEPAQAGKPQHKNRKIKQMKPMKKSVKKLLSAAALIALAGTLCGCEGLGAAMGGAMQDVSSEVNGRYGTMDMRGRADQIEQQVYQQNPL